MKVNFRYDSGYDSEYKQRIQEIVEFILSKNYGDTITNTEASKILKYNIYDETELKKYKNTMCRVKNFLIDYGYVLKSIVGIGYYILKPKQISGYCYHTYVLRTENLLNKSARILSHVDTSELSENRMEELNDVKDLNLDVTNAIDTTIENSRYFDKKSFYDNLED